MYRNKAMNRTRLLRWQESLLFLLVAALVASCDALSDFGNMNVDPTQASTIDPGMQFTTLQLSAAGTRYETWRVNLIYASGIVQHLTQTWWAGDKYTFNEDWATSFWRKTYGGALGVTWRADVKNLEDLLARLRQMKEEGEPVDNKIAATRILRVYIYHRVTDTYGDTPYFEAGKGFLEGNYTPRYDPQQEIYMDMLKELEEAVAQFDPNQPTYGSADLFYGGDITKWKKLAHSLMLRLAMRLVKVDPSTAQQWALKALNGGVMESNDDIAYIQHQTGPWGGPAGLNTNANSEVLSVDNAKLAQTFVDWMKAHNDPRLPIIGAVIKDGQVITDPAVQKGMPSGYDANTIQNHPSWTGKLEDYSRVNPLLTDLDDPIFFVTYAQTALLRAEAAVRGWTSENAAALYAEGVRAAMKQLSLYDAGGAADISDAAIDAYLAANPLSSDPNEALQQINEQYWAATFLDGIEAWANWRRSGYPVLEPAPVDDPNPYPGNVTNGQIPRRLTYPVVEGVLNAANYQEALSRQGLRGDPSDMAVPVWWDRP
ncbi:SusD/RagB family nutrient-binding outer membrane lipoprotein [Rhodothermus profundi]|uniref:Starch-binding associating with outer membrane n=1 Tax=Rhodothermus profundi TaxID=633813 RepID=A0A1M6R851_9BACT|nr:SusD/RagB family nutrient-binding outer membrane lipoprotein [Rhodothermus profundi]SHK28508.1 Starch-binding associating with outer membrane [Rhodothermus profundi]